MPGSSGCFHFQSQRPDKHTTLMACSSPQPSHEPPHQAQSPRHTDRVSGCKKTHAKKPPFHFDNLGLELFPNNACLFVRARSRH